MITLTSQQQAVFDKVKSFLEKDDNDIFILKGYAGTGKTTMIQFIIKHLMSIHCHYKLMAPTGRASKILREKTGCIDASTIHKAIYSNKLICKEVEESDMSKKSYEFVFPLIEIPGDIHTVIVDESSMISDNIMHSEFLKFGSGRLLDDLLKYIKVTKVHKLIFVGDNAQLPPVGDSCSKAFDISYLESLGFRVDTAELTEVLRQEATCGILDEASKMRQLLDKPRRDRNSFEIQSNSIDIIEVPSDSVISKYIEEFPVPSIGNGVIITFSNKQCQDYNKAIRNQYFPGVADVVPGDTLLINTNNYNNGCTLYNGDMVCVLEVGHKELHRNIPVTIAKEKRYVDIEFQNITIAATNGEGQPIRLQCKILLNLLNSDERDISVWECRALYIDFCLRTRFKEGSDDFKDDLKQDPYFNVLKVKYGYAITCHKSQGGEWDRAFVDYSGRANTSDDAIRWCYTATTRAKDVLYVVNPPHIDCMSYLQVLTIIKTSNAPKDFWGEMEDVSTPFHTDSTLTSVKLKCLGIMDSLENTAFKLKEVKSMSYQERYMFEKSDGLHLTISVLYNKDGVFRLLSVTGDDTDDNYLRKIINDSYRQPKLKPYVPSDNGLKELWQTISLACQEIGIQITNVIEDLAHYKVVYNLQTDAQWASILLYYTNGKFTSAQPSSQLGKDDEKLKILIMSL